MIHLFGSYKLKQLIYYVLSVIFIFCIAAFTYFIYFVNSDISIRIVGTVIILLLAAIWLIIEYSRLRPVKYTIEEELSIKRFILMTRDGEQEKEWYCEGINSFLIGKGTVDDEVDMELGDTQYSEYISNNHAVLNYSDGYWYIEDLESVNGVGIKKKGEEYVLRLKPMVSYKVDEGDIIYISKSKILVR